MSYKINIKIYIKKKQICLTGVSEDHIFLALSGTDYSIRKSKTNNFGDLHYGNEFLGQITERSRDVIAVGWTWASKVNNERLTGLLRLFAFATASTSEINRRIEMNLTTNNCESGSFVGIKIAISPSNEICLGAPSLSSEYKLCGGQLHFFKQSSLYNTQTEVFTSANPLTVRCEWQQGTLFSDSDKLFISSSDTVKVTQGSIKLNNKGIGTYNKTTPSGFQIVLQDCTVEEAVEIIRRVTYENSNGRDKITTKCLSFVIGKSTKLTFHVLVQPPFVEVGKPIKHPDSESLICLFSKCKLCTEQHVFFDSNSLLSLDVLDQKNTLISLSLPFSSNDDQNNYPGVKFKSVTPTNINLILSSVSPQIFLSLLSAIQVEKSVIAGKMKPQKIHFTIQNEDTGQVYYDSTISITG